MSNLSHIIGKSSEELKALVEQDRVMAVQLEARIEKLREEIKEGKLAQAESNLDIMEHSNKQTTKELVMYIERIEEQASLDATDRAMLSALNDRLVVCDMLAMKMAELGELEEEARISRNKAEGQPKNEDKEEELAIPKVEHMQGASHIPDSAEAVVSAFSDDSDDDEDPDQGKDDEIKHEDWHTPYRVLNLDHNMPDKDISTEAKKSLARLNLKHNPSRLPNDDDAPRRWEIIMKAYNLVTNPDKRRYLETSHKLPVELLHLDFQSLKLE